MSLWVDKYRPSSLSGLDFHLDQAKQLKKLVDSDDFPHLLIYGPPGSGKKTRIACILHELYGIGVEKQRIEMRQFDAPSGKHLELSVLTSNYHVEMNPSDVGIYDRVVVQEIIKTMAQTQQLDSTVQKDFKVVILNEVDRLTKDAQHALRRTMEKYSATCRLIFCCRSTSKVIAPLRSRCLAIRVAAPAQNDIIRILQKVCKTEGVQISAHLTERIAAKSEGNLRRALLMCETCRVKHGASLGDNVEIPEPEWETFLRDTAALMVKEQSPKQLLLVRGQLYELLCHLIPPDVIFRGLLKHVLQSCDAVLKAEITSAAAEYEHRLHLGSKPVYHLEAFVAKFMSIYKKFLETTLNDLS